VAGANARGAGGSIRRRDYVSFAITARVLAGSRTHHQRLTERLGQPRAGPVDGAFGYLDGVASLRHERTAVLRSLSAVAPAWAARRAIDLRGRYQTHSRMI
jgi:hypothetical protein